MRREKFWFTMSGILAVLAMALMLPAGAGAAGKYKVLYRFTGPDGVAPGAGLLFDAAGNLYGTTAFGGNLSCAGGSGCGTVFKLASNPDGSWTENVLHTFNHEDGYVPSGGLIFDMAGNLYGTTQYGGPNNGKGVVFKLTPNSDGSWTESVLHSFTGNDGEQPSGGVVFDAEGNLYGATEYGGAYSYTGCNTGCGTVFKLAPNPDGSWTESVLHSFTLVGADGGIPIAGLIFDAAGNLYGTAAYGGGFGVVFKLTPNSDGTWNYIVLYGFKAGKTGAYPYAGLIFDGLGNLYGTTVRGGPVDDGVVFKLAPKSDGRWSESLLHGFLGKPGNQPNAGLVLDKAGDLYGTTLYGGPADGGVVFKLTPQSNGSWDYGVLHVFAGKPAIYPRGLVLDKTGNLYGSAQLCGQGRNCSGVVYEITP